MDEIKPYTEMKDSGVDWLGKVPAHWEVIPNRAIFTEIKERNHPDEQMLSVTIKKGVIPQSALLEDTSKKDSSNLDRSNYKLVQTGDIVYNKMRTWQGAIGVSSYSGIVSPAYVVQRIRHNFDSRYFHQLFRIPSFAKEAERWSYGITSDMWSLRPEHFKLIYSCLPPPQEQTAIVRYLDYVDRRVRRYIRAKKKLIKLLEEQKQAIIHRAVTRGLDPDVPMKDSGVEWLGEVPAHWSVVPIKRIVKVKDGTHATPAYLDPSDDTFPLITSKDFSNDQIIFGEAKHISTEDHAEIIRRSNTERGDVLMSMIGGNIGKALIVKTNRQFSIKNVALFKTKENKALATFLLSYLQSHLLDVQIDLLSRGGAQNFLGLGEIRNLVFFKIHQNELNEIVEKMIADIANIARLIAKTNRTIEVLNEYRTRLIADVVTGKLDVREAAANLPEELAETEDLVENGDDLPLETEDIPEEASA